MVCRLKIIELCRLMEVLTLALYRFIIMMQSNIYTYIVLYLMKYSSIFLSHKEINYQPLNINEVGRNKARIESGIFSVISISL
jgi:hypothetical protein